MTRSIEATLGSTVLKFSNAFEDDQFYTIFDAGEILADSKEIQYL